MSQRQAVTKTTAARYKRAGRVEKGTILDELCATTGWHRNHARKALGQGDLLRFMLATGQRIGECLGVLWFEIDLQAGRVDVSSTVIRWTGHGLVRKSTKSKAGERSLLIPSRMVTELQKRFSRGVRMDEPVFANSLGGIRDPKNTRRDVRHALDRADFNWVTSHDFCKTTATLLDQAASPPASSPTSWVTQGPR